MGEIVAIDDQVLIKFIGQMSSQQYCQWGVLRIRWVYRNCGSKQKNAGAALDVFCKTSPIVLTQIIYHLITLSLMVTVLIDHGAPTLPESPETPPLAPAAPPCRLHRLYQKIEPLQYRPEFPR